MKRLIIILLVGIGFISPIYAMQELPEQSVELELFTFRTSSQLPDGRELITLRRNSNNAIIILVRQEDEITGLEHLSGLPPRDLHPDEARLLFEKFSEVA